MIAFIGLGIFVHRGSIRQVSVLVLAFGAAVLVVFSFSSSVLILGLSYLILGFLLTLARVRVRAEIFARLKEFGAGSIYARITNITLACCTIGTVVIGLVGLAGKLEYAYGVIGLIALAGLVFSLFIRPFVPLSCTGVASQVDIPPLQKISSNTKRKGVDDQNK